VHVLIFGAAGMIGRKLTTALVAGSPLAPIDALTLVDVIQPKAPPGFTGALQCTAADLSVGQGLEGFIASRPDVIFHLAAIVSGEAEADMMKGYRVNLDGTRLLLEAIRLEGLRQGAAPYRPRVVFTSSIAVFGIPLPSVIEDDYILAPLSSYGTQKAICELLLADYSRRGFLDGIGLRLPTICVRPGKPNLAASGFFSGIIREPLAGQPAILPVSDTTRHWFASPRAAVGFLTHAATCDLAPLGGRRSLTLPGLSVSVAEEIEALRRVAGDAAVALIHREKDPAIERLVETWPEAFDTARADALGFRADASFDAIIQAHIEDELQTAA
jgi:nucleoside-diphosphate-sugar epimerase